MENIFFSICRTNSASHKKVLNKDINFVFAHIMFYEKMKTIILRCGVLIYCIMDKYICVYYICLHKGLISLKNKGFVNTNFNDISGIGITKLLKKPMSCQVF